MRPERRSWRDIGPRDWLAHAESDLRLAQLARRRRDVLLEQACFHAQQAAEKALKAVLLDREIDFPLVHDLEVLLEIAKAGGLSLPPELLEADVLTPYAVETRYPGGEEPVTPAEADRAVRLAGQVVAWASASVRRAAMRKPRIPRRRPT